MGRPCGGGGLESVPHLAGFCLREGRGSQRVELAEDGDAALMEALLRIRQLAKQLALPLRSDHLW